MYAVLLVIKPSIIPEIDEEKYYLTFDELVDAFEYAAILSEIADTFCTKSTLHKHYYNVDRELLIYNNYYREIFITIGNYDFLKNQYNLA